MKPTKMRSRVDLEHPWRQSEDQQYCICRSNDGTRFMIACDNCEEWYHGDCINVTTKQAANIKRFFCHLCIARNPTLEIEYKTTSSEARQQVERSVSCSEEDEDDDDGELSLPSSFESRPTLRNKRRELEEIWKPPVTVMANPVWKRKPPKCTVEDSTQRRRSSVKTVVNPVRKRRGRPPERRQLDLDEEATEDEMETSGYLVTPKEPRHSNADTCTRCGETVRLQPLSSPARKRRHSLMRRQPSRNENALTRSYPTTIKGVENVARDFKYRQPNRDYRVRRGRPIDSDDMRLRVRNVPVVADCTMGSNLRRGDIRPYHNSRGRETVEEIEVVGGRRPRLVGTHNFRKARFGQNDFNLESSQSDSGPLSAPRYSEESDSDVMIPNQSPPADSNHRHTTRIPPPRTQRASLITDQRNYQYGLAYPDHHYCKNHRSLDWHVRPPTPSPAPLLDPERPPSPARMAALDRLAKRVRPTFSSGNLAHGHDFYTITDVDCEEDLEINWPKETVQC